MWSWRTKLILVLGALAVIAGASFATVSWISGGSEDAKPVPSITYAFQDNHLHGLGYVPEAEGIYLASHYGLFLLRDDQLYQVGESRDDYMGFSRHREDPEVFYASGHPVRGVTWGW